MALAFFLQVLSSRFWYPTPTLILVGKILYVMAKGRYSVAFCFMIIIERKGTGVSNPVTPFQNSVANLLYEFDACTKSSSKYHEISAFFFVSVIIRDIAGGDIQLSPFCCIIFSSFPHVVICVVCYTPIIFFLSR